MKNTYIKDSVHGLILLSEFERDIVYSKGFNRLHDVYQNSMLYLTFPSNRTKRFEHSLGTMKLCSDMLFRSLLNAEPADLKKFYTTFQEEINAVFSYIKEHDQYLCKTKGVSFRDDKIKIEDLKMTKIHPSFIPSNMPKEFSNVHSLIMQSVRIAALLHDIGHPPYSHIVEKALNRMYYTLLDTKDKSELEEGYCKTIKKYKNKDERQLHEEIGLNMTDVILTAVIPDRTTNSYGNDKEQSFYDTTAHIIIKEIVLRILKDEGYFADLHRLIDSSLDGDRLDYITRDAQNSGLTLGQIEYNRIINDMSLFYNENGRETNNPVFLFCIPVKAINSVEDVIRRRFYLYRDILFHHRTLKMNALLRDVIEGLIVNYFYENKVQSLKKEGQNNCIEDNNDKVFVDKPKNKHSVPYFMIPFDISGLWMALSHMNYDNQLFSITQWNDSWLMTVLKQIYYSKYYDFSMLEKLLKELDPANYEHHLKRYRILRNKLAELLLGEKNYVTLIKRREDFQILDKSCKTKLIEYIENDLSQGENVSLFLFLQEELAKEKEKSEDKTSSSDSEKSSNTYINTNLRVYENIIALCKSNNGLLTYISRHIAFISDTGFIKYVENIIMNDIVKMFNSDIMFESEELKFGLGVPIYFFTNNKERILTLHNLSPIGELLKIEKDSHPMFHIFISNKDADTVVTHSKVEILEKIGAKIAEKLFEDMVKKLKEIRNSKG